MMNVNCETSLFTQQDVGEYFFCLESPQLGDFQRNAQELFLQYQQQCLDMHCNEDSEITVKFHLSDIQNQAPWIEAQFSEQRRRKFHFVGQAPANGAHIGLEAYHLKNGAKPKKSYPPELCENHRLINLDHYKILWQQNDKKPTNHAETDMQQAFQKAELQLNCYGGNVKDHTIRTWIYVRDIDNNYASIVKARNQIFEAWGMGSNFHSIASTGIEGQSKSPQRFVSMDSLSILGLHARQIEYMSALDHMPPTRTYGVAFERGTRIIYGDRSHYYISGTASIDKHGKVMHVGDIRAQTQRTIDNVRSLLENHQATLADLKTFTVYLRDPADLHLVSLELDKVIPHTVPRLIVRGSVCRPEWLIEIDGVAINGNGDPQFLPYA